MIVYLTLQLPPVACDTAYLLNTYTYYNNFRAGLVHVFDRHGQRVDEISLQGQGQILSLDWDVDGECLAVLQEGNGVIPIWDSSSRATISVDTNLKDPTFMAWSNVGPQLAVGTAKGNILMYNKKTRKKIPVLGKHPKRITCGAWSDTNQLVLGSTDSTLTVSNDTGDTLEQTQLKRAPTSMCFVGSKRARAEPRPPSPEEGGKEDDTPPQASVVALNLSGKSMLLYSVGDPDRPVELAFQAKYGKIVVHRPFGDRYLLLGFSEVRVERDHSVGGKKGRVHFCQLRPRFEGTNYLELV